MVEMPIPDTQIDHENSVAIQSIGINQPPAVQGPRPLFKLTAGQKSRLLKQSGMTTLNLTELEAIAEIGEFVCQLGLFKIESAKLVASQYDIDLIYAKSVQVDKKCGEDIEKRIQIMQLQNSLMDKKLEAIKIGLKASTDMPQHNRGAGGAANIPFPPNVAVQVNLNHANPAEIEVK